MMHKMKSPHALATSGKSTQPSAEQKNQRKRDKAAPKIVENFPA